MPTLFTIHQIISPSIPMSACFYDHDDLEVTRRDVVCLAIIHFGELENKISVIRPMVCDKLGVITDPGFLPGFLGFEINGVVENWDERIRELVNVIEGKSLIGRKVVN